MCQSNFVIFFRDRKARFSAFLCCELCWHCFLMGVMVMLSVLAKVLTALVVVMVTVVMVQVWWS